MFRIVLILVLILSLLPACQEETTRRSDYTIQGIDVSRYQATVDWDIIASQNMHFAFIKATEGETHTDDHFVTNWTNIKKAGLRRGAYHFFRPRTPANRQADHFVRYVQLTPGDLPPVLDIEVTDGVNPARLVNQVKTWLTLIERHYGIKPIVYTNLKFYNKYLAGQVDEYPLWIARYHHKAPQTASGQAWQFWQYGDRGKITGIDGFVDLNVFRGSWEELDALCISNPVLSGR